LFTVQIEFPFRICIAYFVEIFAIQPNIIAAGCNLQPAAVNYNNNSPVVVVVVVSVCGLGISLYRIFFANQICVTHCVWDGLSIVLLLLCTVLTIVHPHPHSGDDEL